MNRIYRSIWNATLGAWVAAPETARCAGGSASREDGITLLPRAGAQGRVFSRSRLAVAVAAVWGALAIGPAAWAADNVDVGSGLVFAGQQDETVSNTYVGTGSLTKNGVSILTLNGVSTYTGGTQLNAGTLVLGSDSALGTGTLAAASNTVIDSNAAVTLGNDVQLLGAVGIGGSNDLTINGVVGGPGSLAKSGAGTLKLDGVNTYTGGTQLNAGTLVLGNADAIGTGTLAVAGGTLSNSVAMALGSDLQLAGTLTLAGTQDLLLGGEISGSGSLRKTGAADLILSGTNTYTGGTTLLGGRLILGSNGAVGSGALSAANNTVIDSSAAVTLGNNVLLLGAVGIGGSNDLTLHGVVTGPGSLVKNGAGTLTLSGPNTYLSGTTLNAGTLAVGNNASLGVGNLTVGGASSLIASNPSVTVANAIALNANLTLPGANNLTLNGLVSGAGQLVKSGTGTLNLSNSSNTFTGGVALSGGTLVLGNNTALGTGALVTSGTATLRENSGGAPIANAISVNGDLTFQADQTVVLMGLISGSGNIIKTGIDELAIMGTNTFNGTLDIRDGFVTTFNSGALGNPTNVNLGSGTTLNMNGNSSLGGLTGSGVLNIGTGTTVSVGGSNADTVFSGAIMNDGVLRKVGSGALSLTGTSSQSTNLQVSAGTLKIDGTVNGNSKTLVVNSGGTLTGSGSTNLITTIANGGHLAGTSGSTLTLGSTVLNQNSNIDVALGSPLTGNTALFNIDGSLTLDGVLNITDAGGFGDGVYRLFTYTAGSLVNNILDYGTLPSNVLTTELTLQTANPGEVNLIVDSPNLRIRFWDGADNVASGSIEGGTGVWNGSNTNWSSQDGNSNFLWDDTFAVFMGSAGTVTVDGAMAVNGMQFMTDGYQLVSGTNGSLKISNRNDGNFAVRVDPNVTATLDLDLSGSGTLQKVDKGTLVLNGNNSYTGGTLLSGGTLVVGSDSALGTGTLTTAAGTTLDSNTAVALANDMVVTGQLTLPGSNDMTLNGNISGTGSLLKGGASRLTLGGTNTFTGPLALNAGELVLASANALGNAALNAANGTVLDNSLALSLANTINVAGNLTLRGSNDLSLNGLVNGAGRLIKQGSGTLALNGVNGFTGGVDLQSGTLSVGNANALGSGALTVSGTSVLDTSSAMALANAVQLNAGLTLTGSHDLGLSGVISGSSTGSLTKNGLGSLALSGTNTYTGGTTVNAGKLVVTSSQALGLGNVTVNAGGELQVAPGVALSVGGNLHLAAGSIYSIYAAGNASRTNVVGEATLGGMLRMDNAINSGMEFQTGLTYTILHAAGGLSGQFSSVTSNYAYLNTVLTYTDEDVLMQLQRKTAGGGDTGGGNTGGGNTGGGNTGGGNTGGGNTGGGTIRFADLAETGNQRQAAQGVESLPSTHALYKYVETLPAGAPAAVFNSLSGDVQATVGGSLVGLGAFAPSISGQHLRNNMTAGFRAGAPVAQSDGALPASAWPSSKALPAWAEVVGHWQRYDGDGNAAQLKQRTTGLFLGMDEEVGTSGWRLGGSLGYTNADGKVADRSSESDVNSYSAAVYGGKSFGTGTGPRINVLGGLAYTWHDIETTRRVAGLGQTLKADYSAHTAQLFAEVGYAIGQYDKVGFEPFVGVSLGQQRTGSFQERGGFAALHGSSNTDDLASTTLGLRVHSDFQLAGKEGRLRATVGWRHAFGDLAQSKTMAFEGGQNFTVAGTPLARNTAVLGLEADVALSRSAALVLGYQGEMGSGQRDHSASVKLRWAF